MTIVGYADEPEVDMLFETGRVFYVHQQCAVWSSNNRELSGEIVSPFVVQASSRRCAYCSHYGAGISCKVTIKSILAATFFYRHLDNVCFIENIKKKKMFTLKVGSCNRYYHFPCAAASSSFHDANSLSLFCSQHLGQVPLLSEY